MAITHSSKSFEVIESPKQIHYIHIPESTESTINLVPKVAGSLLFLTRATTNVLALRTLGETYIVSGSLAKIVDIQEGSTFICLFGILQPPGQTSQRCHRRSWPLLYHLTWSLSPQSWSPQSFP